MRPENRRRGLPRPAAGRIGIRLGALGLAILLGGCAKPLVLDATLPQQFAEIACVEECRATKEQCDADARYDYRQCQAGYDTSFRTYRWCLASAIDRDDCGYPGWSCAENLYGYCSNRYHDCEKACRNGG
ncbi:hypothetical protein [Imhoffiella purpurea]|uniref:Lipoprotein n=1 Tax=Imhoffiella purpurea TaxID=1249627 RepID=W9VCW3_9GAMM|nr:hypothetical protein [Imhoffiella purpurea]EXJ13867.1 hypothetical protein D779_3230 [Imhoffiella purpurea]